MNQTFIDLLVPFLPSLNGRPLAEDSRLHDLGLNSMKSIDLLFAIEDELSVSLPDDDLNDSTFAPQSLPGRPRMPMPWLTARQIPHWTILTAEPSLAFTPTGTKMARATIANSPMYSIDDAPR